MTKIRLLVVGAGGHGLSVAEAAELSGQFEIVGLLDDSLPAGESVLGVPVLGPVVSMAHHRAARVRHQIPFFQFFAPSILTKSST
jgi:FlaA1/EpsC-like NDP-sugar epimerase